MALTDSTTTVIQSYGYDANGNRTSSGADSYSYDWANQLSSATVSGATVNYAYSGDDLRTSRTEGGVNESYLWDRLSTLPAMVSDGATTSIHGPTGIANEITGTTASYALTDGLGSARAWTNSSGTAVGATDWDVWGMTRSTSGSTGLHGYTGERADPTTNLVYLRARDYSPGTACFVQPDPIQPNAPGTHGFNPYWYANANPATLTDPGGTSAGYYESLTKVHVELAGYALLGYSIASIVTTVAGAGTALLTIATFVGTAFLLLAIVLLIIAVIFAVTAICAEHGCTLPSLPEGSVYGWIKGTYEAGKSTVSWGIAGVATGACIAAMAFPGIGISPVIASQCGPTRECAGELGEEPLEQLSEVVGIGKIELPNLYEFARGDYASSGACDPTPCKRSPLGQRDGGIYILVHNDTGEIHYVGRTIEFKQRKSQWNKVMREENLRFEEVYHVQPGQAQRGLEMIQFLVVWAEQGSPPRLNKINPVGLNNKSWNAFMNAARDELGC